MSTYLNNIRSTNPAVYEAKKNLNEEFEKKGRILDALSVLYYPVQHGPMSHGEIEIEGDCYYFRSGMGPRLIPKVGSYHKRLYKIQRSDNEQRNPDLGFVRFGITTTPEQLKNIREKIGEIRSMLGITCMHAVKRVLKKYVNFSIPLPISLFPTLTAITLYSVKNTLGNHRISSIDPHVSHRPLPYLAIDSIFAFLPGIMAAMTLYIGIQILSKTLI